MARGAPPGGARVKWSLGGWVVGSFKALASFEAIVVVVGVGVARLSWFQAPRRWRARVALHGAGGGSRAWGRRIAGQRKTRHALAVSVFAAQHAQHAQMLTVGEQRVPADKYGSRATQCTVAATRELAQGVFAPINIRSPVVLGLRGMVRPQPVSLRVLFGVLPVCCPRVSSYISYCTYTARRSHALRFESVAHRMAAPLPPFMQHVCTQNRH